MKKESPFGKITSFPETTPEVIPAKPKEEARTANKLPSTNQADTNNEVGFSGELNIRIPKSLHAQLNEQANKEGVSFSEYIIYKLSQ